MKREVEAAIKSMKNGKAVGEDGITVEMIKEEWGVDVVTKLANRLYGTGQIPSAMQQSTFITIPRKSGAMEGNKFRTISIISQLEKK